MSVIGHEKNLNLLLSLYEKEDIFGSWLLVGPKGVGKATTAYAAISKIYGKNAQALKIGSHGAFKVLECDLTDEEKKKRQALIESGKELDPEEEAKRKRKASISIDDVRKVIDFTGYKAFSSEPKIILIDSINEMQAEAANALLKTLEEPPERTAFLLICHNEHRILETIRSRCRRIYFKSVPEEIIERHIGSSEIARLANGCPGVAEALVKQKDLIANFMSALKTRDKKSVENIMEKLLKEEEGAFIVRTLLLDEIHQQALKAPSKMQEHLSTLYNETEKRFNQSEFLYLDTKKVILNQIVKMWG